MASLVCFVPSAAALQLDIFFKTSPEGWEPHLNNFPLIPGKPGDGGCQASNTWVTLKVIEVQKWERRITTLSTTMTMTTALPKQHLNKPKDKPIWFDFDSSARNKQLGPWQLPRMEIRQIPLTIIVYGAYSSAIQSNLSLSLLACIFLAHQQWKVIRSSCSRWHNPWCFVSWFLVSLLFKHVSEHVLYQDRSRYSIYQIWRQPILCSSTERFWSIRHPSPTW
jgi:hypothetical protein